MRKVIVCPQGGIGNRMRALYSADRFCKENNLQLKVCWPLNRELNCRFETCFVKLPNLKNKKTDFTRFIEKGKRKSYLFICLLRLLEKLNIFRYFNDENGAKNISTYVLDCTAGKIKPALITIMSTCTCFYWEDYIEKFNNDLFRLNNEMESLVRKETIKFTPHTIGVHIRRTDNVDSIEKSPTELFIARMEEEIQNNELTTFYVASDSVEVKQLLLDKFGHERVFLPQGGNLDRNSESGIVQAVVELYALSRTCKVLGSYWSSFSTTAAMLGKIKKETIVKE